MRLKTARLNLTLPNLPFEIGLLPSTTCLVGGAVRDALLGRHKPYWDLDFVLPEKAVETAKIIAHKYDGGFVVLDDARQIARVVFPQGTLDFALQEGETLEKDLRRRDFTVNAIAYNMRQRKAIDPLGGIQDLEHRVIRMVSPENLQDDPLRLLRAYRQASQLDFQIDSETRNTIHDLANLLPNIAAERVQNELTYLFESPLGSKWLQAAWEDGLIDPWLSDLNREKFAQIATLETIQQFLTQKWPNFGSTTPKYLMLAKLSTLVSSDPDIAELELEKLKYSRSHIKAVVATVRHLPRLQILQSTMSLRQQYFFFLDVKNFFPILALRAIVTGVAKDIILPMIERYLNPQDPVAHPKPLVSGKDLILRLNLNPSPIIGELLTEIQIAYIEEKIFDAEDAMLFATDYLANNWGK
ncbi:tRNA nucleotidyltransferase/poly(A) polymerase [Xenococcus sp. PCC 7305]|uniref:CCA tRNA nucleotidyltransferase n=1 Tax=Xenococcus sp. PCC 7305 TaxID=102125 RepID=UPI0002AC4192|nr:CCA tRNA nucleotidyltransferase [Xenococcus sp. PCC 7305]ELS02274.1 tRNA nucleotidyltransferase/poly(A) polymerase [Xenococcus sp. PCC 7305]